MNKKHNKEEIISRGQRLLRRNGYNGTGVEQILKANDLSKGSFYNFFNSKEDFVRQVLNKYASNQYVYIIQKLKDTGLSPLARLKSFYSSMIAFNGGENCVNGCLLANITMEMGGISDTISEDTDNHYNRITGLIADCIKEGQDAGEITNEFEASEIAAFVHNGFNGSLLRSKASRSTKHQNIFLEITFNFIRRR